MTTAGHTASIDGWRTRRCWPTMPARQPLDGAPPPDPMQARIMMALPFVFTFLFLFFPSGLVLYWFVNNLLSIAQQWVITKKIVGKIQ